MPPDLVVADAAYKVYPGGVIVVRASDWMGPARGTLSTAADTLSCTGTHVQDTQQVTNNMFTNATTALDAYAEAEDTLEIPVSAIPLKSTYRYEILVSLRIVGDWDTTNPDTMTGATQAKFSEPRGPVAVGWHGAGTNRTLESQAAFLARYFRGLPHYVTTNIPGGGATVLMRNPQPGETMHFRAYSQDGTTLEVFLDQILFFPYMKGFPTVPDNRIIGGQVNVPTSTTLPPVDGADGGDANGEFTWAPQPGIQNVGNLNVESMTVWQPESGLFDVNGGGDYQRVASYDDAERYTRLDAADGQTLENTSGGESPAVAYTLAGVRYLPAQTFVFDDFSRTTIEGSGLDAWGDAPGGFMWTTAGGLGSTYVVEGGVAKWKLPGAQSATSFLYDGATARVEPASINVWEAFNFYGEFRIEANPNWLSGTGTERTDISIRAIPLNTTQGELANTFIFSNTANHLDFVFRFVSGGAASHTLFTGSIASWYSHGDWIAWRMEKRRYLVRIKVWDATGAEPGSWDFTGFIPVEGAALGSKIDYDYANNPRDAIKSNGMFGPGMSATSSPFGSGPHEVWWDNIGVDYDPGGDPEDMSIAIEHPEGTKVAEIAVPYGAAHFVYWGTEDWTDSSAGNFNLEYSTRVWNDLAAAELQRAEEVLSWFGIFEPTIIPMNWRSSERPGSVWRVLVGDR